MEYDLNMKEKETPMLASFSTKLNFPQCKDCFWWVQLKKYSKGERPKDEWLGSLGQPEIIEFLRLEKNSLSHWVQLLTQHCQVHH